MPNRISHRMLILHASSMTPLKLASSRPFNWIQFSFSKSIVYILALQDKLVRMAKWSLLHVQGSPRKRQKISERDHRQANEEKAGTCSNAKGNRGSKANVLANGPLAGHQAGFHTPQAPRLPGPGPLRQVLHAPRISSYNTFLPCSKAYFA